jgi:hypothetical protein
MPNFIEKHVLDINFTILNRHYLYGYITNYYHVCTLNEEESFMFITSESEGV